MFTPTSTLHHQDSSRSSCKKNLFASISSSDDDCLFPTTPPRSCTKTNTPPRSCTKLNTPPTTPVAPRSKSRSFQLKSCGAKPSRYPLFSDVNQENLSPQQLFVPSANNNNSKNPTIRISKPCHTVYSGQKLRPPLNREDFLSTTRGGTVLNPPRENPLSPMKPTAQPSKPQIMYNKNKTLKQFDVDFSVTLGSGSSSHVYPAKHRLDGWHYAIKQVQPYSNVSNNELNFAAALGAHPNLVRYHSCWIEDDCLSIQFELCSGSLRGVMDNKPKLLETPRQLTRIFRHVLKGLKHIHKRGFAHLDIKPSNIFFAHKPIFVRASQPSDAPLSLMMDDTGTGSSSTPRPASTLYKIGDFGNMCKVADVVTGDFEEGDSRYVPLELLQPSNDDVRMADIFSLGLTMYETITRYKLPKGGQEWDKLRRDGPTFTHEQHKRFGALTSVIKAMMSMEPSKRPTCAQLLDDTPLFWSDKKRKQFQQLAIQVKQHNL